MNCILFFGTEFLCGTEPPVFKLHKTDTGASEYISVVETASPKDEVSLNLFSMKNLVLHIIFCNRVRRKIILSGGLMKKMNLN